MDISKSSQHLVYYLSCQAARRTVYLIFCSGHMRKGLGLALDGPAQKLWMKLMPWGLRPWPWPCPRRSSPKTLNEADALRFEALVLALALKVQPKNSEWSWYLEVWGLYLGLGLEGPVRKLWMKLVPWGLWSWPWPWRSSPKTLNEAGTLRFEALVRFWRWLHHSVVSGRPVLFILASYWLVLFMVACFSSKMMTTLADVVNCCRAACAAENSERSWYYGAVLQCGVGRKSYHKCLVGLPRSGNTSSLSYVRHPHHYSYH